MKSTRTTFEISLRDARKAQMIISDISAFDYCMEQNATNFYTIHEAYVGCETEYLDMVHELEIILEEEEIEFQSIQY